MKQNVKIAKELMKLAKNLVAKSYLQDPKQKVKYLQNLLIELMEDGLNTPLKSNTNLDPIFISKSMEEIERYCDDYFPLIRGIFIPLQLLLGVIDDIVIRQKLVHIRTVGLYAPSWINEIRRILDEIKNNYDY